jgi:hypothetical protein
MHFEFKAEPVGIEGNRRIDIVDDVADVDCSHWRPPDLFVPKRISETILPGFEFKCSWEDKTRSRALLLVEMLES